MFGNTLLVGQRVDFVQSRVPGYAPEIISGVIVDVSVSDRHGVEYRIAPEAVGKMTRWRKPEQVIAIYGGKGCSKTRFQ